MTKRCKYFQIHKEFPQMMLQIVPKAVKQPNADPPTLSTTSYCPSSPTGLSLRKARQTNATTYRTRDRIDFHHVHTSALRTGRRAPVLVGQSLSTLQLAYFFPAYSSLFTCRPNSNPTAKATQASPAQLSHILQVPTSNSQFNTIRDKDNATSNPTTAALSSGRYAISSSAKPTMAHAKLQSAARSFPGKGGAQ